MTLTSVYTGQLCRVCVDHDTEVNIFGQLASEGMRAELYVCGVRVCAINVLIESSERGTEPHTRVLRKSTHAHTLYAIRRNV